RGADLLVTHSYQAAAVLVHSQLPIPWVCASLYPGQFWHRKCPVFIQPAPRADLNLLASSPTFSQPDLEINAHLALTGFWFSDGLEQDDWQPTASQRHFVESGEPPLVLCLGSLPSREAVAVAKVHVQAADRLGRRMVIQSGWADLAEDELRK